MKSSRLVLVLSLVAVAAVVAHAHKPPMVNALVAVSHANTLSESSQQDDKPAEQANKNIQVLRGVPNSQLLTVMHFMRTSLGVRCDYCHIAENGKYWMDDKPAKLTARKMIAMVAEINQANFGGQPVVTCNTCHRGQTKPVAVPDVSQGVFANTTREEPGTRVPEPLPSVDQVLERYYRAIGWPTASQKVNTRVTRLSLLRPKLVNSGTPNAAMIARGETWTMEIFQKSPNKYLAISTSPNGIIYQGFNGTTGWVKTPQGQREMNSTELARIVRQADLFGDFKLKEQYTEMSVSGRDRMDGREVLVIAAQPILGSQASQPASRRQVKFFFDTQTGLLLRRTVLTETRLGLDPEQTDFKDYTDIDGIKLPFTIITSYLDDSHLGTTRKYIEVKHNTPIDDSKFEMPSK
jgi:photosynthetic reaction center cytochrome c subunit